MIMKRFYKFVVLAAFSLLAVHTSAQQFLAVPYGCGFETTESETANWVLNPGSQASQCRDQWYIGAAIRESGSQSLFITRDTGQTCSYGKRPNLQFAYRDVLLPAGTYVISFDWYCEGANDASLQMGYCLNTNTNVVANSTSGTMPAQLSSWVQKANLHGSTDGHWQNENVNIQANGTRVYRIFFAWSSNNTQDNNFVAAAVDNIQITSANCPRPQNIIATATSCDSVFVSWTGSSAEYELQYRQSGNGYWSRVTGIPGGSSASTILSGLSENLYDIRVRGICSPDTSAWTYESGFILFCPEQHCINYVDLHDPSCVCTYGSGYNGYNSNPQVAYSQTGVIDYGPASKASRHTVNWDRTATDPRTNNQLLLVAPNEFASVRLGNWETGAEAEAVTYTYNVDSSSAILLMKYAVVLEEPGHSAAEQPRFVLDILDAQGNMIDPTCGHCDFAASSTAQGWVTVGSGYSAVVYKPWTLIGLNLNQYINQTIKIRLTTYDCSQSGHYGYAYFTLGCASATIKTTSCASDPTVQMSLSAPDGFDYQWYHSDGTPVPVGQGGKSQTLDVASSDTTTYTCVLTSKENPACSFSLKSQCMPRKPMADFSYQLQPENCKNKVVFNENTFIRTEWGGEITDHLDEHCEGFEWEFWNTSGFHSTSSRANPTVVFPNAGGTFQVKLTGYISGDCSADTTISITLPEVKDYQVNLDTTLCQGEYIKWEDVIIARDCDTTVHMKTIYGCDSTIHLRLHINPTYDIRNDTVEICAGDVYCEDGECYTRGTSGMFIRRLTTALGCDSALMRYVIVHDSILPTVTQDSIDSEHGKFTAALTFDGTGYDHLIINGTDTLWRDSTESLVLDSLGLGFYYVEYVSEYGCSKFDTILIGGACLRVSMEPQIQCQQTHPVSIFPFSVDSGMVTYYSIQYDQLALDAGFVDVVREEPVKMGGQNYQIEFDLPVNCEPDYYTATIILEDLVCGDVVMPVNFIVTYPASVIFFRWDDVISLKNQNYVPFSKYSFDHYQWYRNGAPLMNDTLSYYYQEGGLFMDSTYSVELTRNDGKVFMTCSYVPSIGEDLDVTEYEVMVSPTLVNAGELISICLNEKATAEFYTTTGTLVKTETLHNGTNFVSAPKAAGVYLLRVRLTHGANTTKITVIQ